MLTIALTYPSYTDLQTLLDSLASATGCRIHTDADIMETTASDHGIPPELLRQVVQVAPIAFNNFTHEREKALAALGKTLSGHINTGNCIFAGIICQLIPDPLTHVFRILALSSRENRIQAAIRSEGCSLSQAKDLIHRADDDALRWGNHIKTRSPWEEARYHLVLDMDAGEPPDLQVARIRSALTAPPFSGQNPRQKEVDDLNITADVYMALAGLGGGLTANADNGRVTVILDRKRMNLPQTQARIKAAVNAIPEVASLEIKIGPRYYESDMIKTFDFESSTGPWKWGSGK